ncbi:FkbM family methyltransferase [Chlorobaculum sp. 24CR]|uniref:FkbM family methyltransferase n=1 Tax=Chlorobaculum sp. 24CR TaxID=2508878 RepID=UPI00100BAA61|nr:FkbM family methyltransferase [Chlorobaculum sp. 24CR]RXK89430.1 FkbM family methyltransferase [Chlorobaculum sp. 24CR]
MQFYTRSKILLRQILGHELKAEVELYCKTFNAGDWAFSPIGINSSSVIFSAGTANDIRFDKSLINSFACNVHAFDPNPKWIDWIRAQRTPPEFHFHPFTIGNADGTVRLREDAVEVPAKRVQTVMSELGVEAIDILKMDIESAEYEVIDDILDSGVPVYQLLVEFHHRFKNVPIEKTKSVLEKLSAAGYRIFHISEKYREFSFIHEQTYYRHVDESLNGLIPKSCAVRSA